MMHIVISLLAYLVECQFLTSCVSVLLTLLQIVCVIAQKLIIRFIMSYGINFAAGVSLVGKNVTFCSDRYNFKTCDFISGVVNVTRAIQQYCRSAMSESSARVCHFVLGMLRCPD